MNRRRFLGRMEGVAAGAVLAGMGLPLQGCIGFHYVTGTLAEGRVRLRRADFGAEPFALVDVPGFAMPLYVYRHGDGGFSAVSTRCMHQGCQVEPVAGHLICPCHGSEYANDGAVLKGPTLHPLRHFPTAVEADAVVIDLAGGEP